MKASTISGPNAPREYSDDATATRVVFISISRRKAQSDAGIRRTSSAAINDGDIADTSGKYIANSQSPASKPAVLDHTVLNRLKARMMKAQLRGANDAASLEAEYNAALASSTNFVQPEIVVLGAMDNRMLAGARNNEVKNVNTKRGRERGLVEENEDMSIEDSGLSVPSILTTCRLRSWDPRHISAACLL